MSLAITEDHRELAKVVRDIAAKYQLTAQARAALSAPAAELDSAWPVMAKLGWCGLHLPADLGGSGFGLPELAIVLDELGAAVAPGPFLAASIGSAVIAATGSDDLRRTLLPAAATGTSVIAYGTANGLDIAGGVATGRVERVLGGAWADRRRRTTCCGSWPRVYAGIRPSTCRQRPSRSGRPSASSRAGSVLRRQRTAAAFGRTPGISCRTGRRHGDVPRARSNSSSSSRNSPVYRGPAWESANGSC
jgi:hypothetical protein